MAQNYPKSLKNCAACDYWGGSRQVDTFGQHVTVDSSNSRGKCLLQSGAWKGQDVRAASSCIRWRANSLRITVQEFIQACSVFSGSRVTQMRAKPTNSRQSLR